MSQQALRDNEQLHKILIIRRDNIGDLVLTTPLIAALRERWPKARMDVLVNSYNAPVLANNPDISNIYAYTKGKHRESGETLWRAVSDKMLLLLRLRRFAYERVILANSGFDRRSLALAHWIAPHRIVGFADPKRADARLTYALQPLVGVHHVESLWPLAQALGVTQAPSVAKIWPDAILQQLAKPKGERPLWGVHISARKPSQRWQAEHFVDWMAALAGEVDFRLFWSPGAENDAKHPGDDGKARTILTQAAARGIPLEAWPTQTLPELIAGLSVCSGVLCSDGGAMHVAAALGLPMVAFFGQSDATHWRPWGVPHVLLQPPSRQVSDVSVSEALNAWRQLQAQS